MSFCILNISLIFTGMVTALDDAIGNLTESLKQAGLFDNTLIIFTSDVSNTHILSVEFDGLAVEKLSVI